MLHQAANVLFNDGQAVLGGEQTPLLGFVQQKLLRILAEFLRLIFFQRHFTHVNQLFKYVLHFVLENDNFARQHSSVGSVFSQEVVETVGVEACVGPQSSKSPLLSNQRL
jgi:hypothetical protein